MTGIRTPTGRRRVVMRVLGLALALGLALSLSACANGQPSGGSTVTVWVDPPTEAAQPRATESSSDPSPSSEHEIPSELAAGHLRGAVTSFGEARSHFEDANKTVRISEFRSPSGNIFCRIDSDSAECEVRAGRVAPPVEGICTGDGRRDVGRLELDASRARPVCNDDSIRDSTGDSAPKLAYGRRAEVSGVAFTCLSEEKGVTCIEPGTEHGFWIARGSFATF